MVPSLQNSTNINYKIKDSSRSKHIFPHNQTDIYRYPFKVFLTNKSSVNIESIYNFDNDNRNIYTFKTHSDIGHILITQQKLIMYIPMCPSLLKGITMKRKILPLLLSFALAPTLAHAENLTTTQAISQLKLTELAATYNADKIKKSTGNGAASSADALLIDMEVITRSDLSKPDVLSDKLNVFVQDQSKLDEQYLGNVSDRNIVERIKKAWQTSQVLSDKSTLNLLNSFIDNGYTSGYNVIDTRNNSHFDPKRMISYGHNNIQHAAQLVYLMKTEGFDPKVQFVPKSSAFLYLPEWGKPSYPVTTLESGKMIAIVKEYNLDFEFQTIERKAAFMDLISQYAKKDSKDEKGLIYESWWQPFYRSYTEMDNYKLLIENRVLLGKYQADLMSLPEKAKIQQQGIKTIKAGIKIEPIKAWVNPSFYRYMQGDFK